MLKFWYHIYKVHYLPKLFTKSLGWDLVHQPRVSTPSIFEVNFTCNFAQKPYSCYINKGREIPTTDIKHTWPFKILCHIYLNHYLSLDWDPVHQPRVSKPPTFEVNFTYNFCLPQNCTAATPNKELKTHTTFKPQKAIKLLTSALIENNGIALKWVATHSRMTPLFSMRAIAGMTALTILSLNRPTQSTLHSALHKNCTATTSNGEIKEKMNTTSSHHTRHHTGKFRLSTTCFFGSFCEEIFISCKLSMGQDCLMFTWLYL